MAKNYTLKEAVEIIVVGEDAEAIMELGKRFPLLTVKVAKIGAVAGETFMDLMNYMPEHITANKINSAIKNTIQESDDVEDEEETEEAPKKAAKPAKKAEKEVEDDADESDYDSMTGNALVDLCKERGIWKGLKDKKKGGMIAALKAYDENGGDSEEDADADEEAAGKYDGKSAMELFKECKKRGIKAAPKKPAKFYVDLLEKADAAESEEAEDDEWGEEEEEAPKKSKNPAPKAKAAKAKAKKEAEDDEDEDWDI